MHKTCIKGNFFSLFIIAWTEVKEYINGRKRRRRRIGEEGKEKKEEEDKEVENCNGIPTVYSFSVCLLPLHEALPDSWVGPTFTSRFSKKVTYLNTEGVVVPCSAYGNPFPRIEWIESNGTQISRADGALEVLSNGSIRFHAFRDEYFRIRIHSRRLRCRAQNQVGSIISEEIHVRPGKWWSFKAF